MRLSIVGPVRIELLEDGMSARLLERLVVHWDDVFLLAVPAGFETDFASVPRIFWRIVPPWGRYSPAAVVHDWLYTTGWWSRSRADWILLALMASLGVPVVQRWIMYLAVRLFGGGHYKRGGPGASLNAAGGAGGKGGRLKAELRTGWRAGVGMFLLALMIVMGGCARLTPVRPAGDLAAIRPVVEVETPRDRAPIWKLWRWGWRDLTWWAGPGH